MTPDQEHALDIARETLAAYDGAKPVSDDLKDNWLALLAGALRDTVSAFEGKRS